MMSQSNKPLDGLHILLVEDEYLIAADMDNTLTRLGAQVIGPAPTVEDAMEAISNASRIDGALLDINLGEERSFVVAQTLSDRDIPVVFVTGYDALVLPASFSLFPRLNKPFNPAALAEVLSRMANR